MRNLTWGLLNFSGCGELVDCLMQLRVRHTVKMRMTCRWLWHCGKQVIAQRQIFARRSSVGLIERNGKVESSLWSKSPVLPSMSHMWLALRRTAVSHIIIIVTPSNRRTNTATFSYIFFSPPPWRRSGFENQTSAYMSEHKAWLKRL